MAIPVLKLNLAPPSNFWRLNHVVLSWAALVAGGGVLAMSLGLTWMAYRSAALTGKLAGNLANRTRSTAGTQAQILAELRNIDVAKELPRWRLAERIYTERSLPWSRLTSELERSLVQDVRVKSIQRNRGTDMKVQIKLKGEARSREAEAAFVESLQKNRFFDQVSFEREGERQGGGVEFDYNLTASSTPPPYQPLPRFAPRPRTAVAATRQTALPAAAPVRGTPQVAVPGPQNHGQVAVPGPQSHGQVAVPMRPAPVYPVPYGIPAVQPGTQGPPAAGTSPGRPPRRVRPARPVVQEGEE